MLTQNTTEKYIDMATEKKDTEKTDKPKFYARAYPLFDPNEPPDDLGAIWTHVYEYDDGRLEFGRDTEPRFVVPIILDDAGEYHFDRENVQWIDGILFAEERDKLLDQFDNARELGQRVRDLKPVNTI